MLENKFFLLLQRLHQKTADGTLGWEPGSAQGTFIATLGEFVVGIQAKPDPEYPDDPDIFIRVYNSEGTTIEEFSNATFRGVETGEVNAYAMMKELSTRARRSAYGVEQAIDILLEHLE